MEMRFERKQALWSKVCLVGRRLTNIITTVFNAWLKVKGKASLVS